MQITFRIAVTVGKLFTIFILMIIQRIFVKKQITVIIEIIINIFAVHAEISVIDLFIFAHKRIKLGNHTFAEFQFIGIFQSDNA